MTSSAAAVAAALRAVVSDHGWLAASNPTRLRAALSDVMGAEASEHRAWLDAFVVSAEEGVPAAIRSAGREQASAVRQELLGRLEGWGMSHEQATIVLDTWAGLLGDSTALPPGGPVVRDSEPEHDPAEPGRGGMGATVLPSRQEPVGTSATELPPSARVGGQPATVLPPHPSTAPGGSSGAADTDADRRQAGRRRPPAWGWVAAGATLVVGVGVIGLLVWRGDPTGQTGPAGGSTAADVVFRGQPVTNASAALTAADHAFEKVLSSRDGSAKADARCYFGVSDAGGAQPKVEDSLYCGPLSTLDGHTPEAPFLKLSMVGAQIEEGVQLVVGDTADQKAAPVVGLPENRSLFRPDEPVFDPPPYAPADTLRADARVQARPLEEPVGMASRKVGIGLTALSQAYRFSTGASEGERWVRPGTTLIAFDTTEWDCDQYPYEDCASNPERFLRVRVGSSLRRLPPGGGPYVLAVPDGERRVELVMEKDGITQTLSLRDGRPGRGNIAVLRRQWGDRYVDIDPNRKKRLTETTSIELEWPDGSVRSRVYRDTVVGWAELDFFRGNQRPRGPGKAFLVVGQTFTRPAPYGDGETYVFETGHLRFKSGGRTYQARDLDPRESIGDMVFEVPGDLVKGTLLIGGSIREVSTTGTPYLNWVETMRVPIRFGAS